MARKRKRVLGLRIGPPEPPRRLRKVAGAAAAGAAVSAVALVSSRLAKRGPSATTPAGSLHPDAAVRGPTGGSTGITTSPEARASAQRASIEARKRRADLQRQLKSDRVTLADVFGMADRDDTIGKTRVKIILQNLPGVGPAGAMNAMDELGIPPGRRLRGLGAQQRQRLLERFVVTA